MVDRCIHLKSISYNNKAGPREINPYTYMYNTCILYSFVSEVLWNCTRKTYIMYMLLSDHAPDV